MSPIHELRARHTRDVAGLRHDVFYNSPPPSEVLMKRIEILEQTVEVLLKVLADRENDGK